MQSVHMLGAKSRMCSRFESICKIIVQAAGHPSMNVMRVDLAADKLIRKLPGFIKQALLLETFLELKLVMSFYTGFSWPLLVSTVHTTREH